VSNVFEKAGKFVGVERQHGSSGEKPATAPNQIRKN
jgi:hypothetical protein